MEEVGVSEQQGSAGSVECIVVWVHGVQAIMPLTAASFFWLLFFWHCSTFHNNTMLWWFHQVLHVQHLRDSRIFCHGAFLLQWVCLQNRVKCSHANRSKWLVTHKGEEEDFSRTQRFLSTKFFLPSCLHLKKDFVISHQDAKGRGNTSLHQLIYDLLQTNASNVGRIDARARIFIQFSIISQ